MRANINEPIRGNQRLIFSKKKQYINLNFPRRAFEQNKIIERTRRSLSSFYCTQKIDKQTIISNVDDNLYVLNTTKRYPKQKNTLGLQTNEVFTYACASNCIVMWVAQVVWSSSRTQQCPDKNRKSSVITEYNPAYCSNTSEGPGKNKKRQKSFFAPADSSPNKCPPARQWDGSAIETRINYFYVS